MTKMFQGMEIQHGDRVAIDRTPGMAPMQGLVTDVFEGHFGKLYEVTEFLGENGATPHYFSEFDECIRKARVIE